MKNKKSIAIKGLSGILALVLIVSLALANAVYAQSDFGVDFTSDTIFNPNESEEATEGNDSDGHSFSSIVPLGSEMGIFSPNVLTIDLAVVYLDGDSLQYYLNYYYTASQIAAADTLKFTGSSSGDFTIGYRGGLPGTAPSVTYLNSLSNIKTIDLTSFTGTLGEATFRNAMRITTIILGDNITSLPYNAFNNCSSLKTLSNSLANASLNPNIIDLDSTNVDTLEASGSQFANCIAIETVALGSDITSLPEAVFGVCRSLKTLSITCVGASLNQNIIDLDSTNVDTLEAGGAQFGGCWAIETVALGNKITRLPSSVFNNCATLKTLSNTIVNASLNPNIVDLDITNVDELVMLSEDGLSHTGNQFNGCKQMETVALGSKITSLPWSVFSSCDVLKTLSATVAGTSLNPNIIDLDSTNVDTLAIEGEQFYRCFSVDTVALGSKITSFPFAIFEQTALGTASDTVANVHGESKGLVDVANLPNFTTYPGAMYAGLDGSQFFLCQSAIIYIDVVGFVIQQRALSYTGCIFVPESNTQIEFASGATGMNANNPPQILFYLRGNQGSPPSPTTIINPDNYSLAGRVTYYYEAEATSKGNGTIVADMMHSGFIGGAIDARERLENRLVTNTAWAKENQSLQYIITPDAGYSIFKIEASVAGGTPINISTSCVDNGDGTWSVPGVTDDTEFIVTFGILGALSVTYDANNSTSGSYIDTTTYSAGNNALVETFTDTGLSAETNYVFSHWNTAANDSGTNYNPGDSITMTDNITLYAIYNLQEYDVTYHAGTGAGTSYSDSAGPFNVGDTVTVLGNTVFTKANHTFIGWNPNQAQATAGTIDSTYDPAETFTMQSANVDLYAVWQANTLPTTTTTTATTIVPPTTTLTTTVVPTTSVPFGTTVNAITSGTTPLTVPSVSSQSSTASILTQQIETSSEVVTNAETQSKSEVTTTQLKLATPKTNDSSFVVYLGLAGVVAALVMMVIVFHKKRVSLCGKK